VTAVNALLIGRLVVDLGPVRLSQRDMVTPLLVMAGVLLVRRLVNGRPVPLPGLAWARRLGWPSVPGLYVALLVVGVLASLGPAVDVGPDLRLRPLYWQLYRAVPGVEVIRAPARFALLGVTALAVLAGYGVAALQRRAGPRAARAVVAGAAGLGVLEAWPAPLGLEPVPAPGQAVHAWLAAAPRPGPVVVLPMWRPPEEYREAARLLGSTAHWRPLVNGYASFFPRGHWETVETLSLFPAPPALARLRLLGVRYVVVHPGEAPRPERARLEAALAALPPGLAHAATLDGAAVIEVLPGP
jgi:hypothetical protein